MNRFLYPYKDDPGTSDPEPERQVTGQASLKRWLDRIFIMAVERREEKRHELETILSGGTITEPDPARQVRIRRNG